MRRVIPFPLLFVSLLLVWPLLNGFTPGHLILGLIVAFIATHATVSLEPPSVKIYSWSAIVRLSSAVFVDIIASNLAVLKLVLFDRPDRKHGYVAVPLELRNRTGLVVLALIINCAPGTAWLEYDSASGIALIHVLDYTSDEDLTTLVKDRYEKPLREIFG